MSDSFEHIRLLLRQSPATLSQILVEDYGTMNANEILYAMRLLCEAEYNDPRHLTALHGHPNSLISDCALAYSELEGLTSINEPYASHIPYLTKVCSQPELFLGRSELFPRGALSIRDHTYVEQCWRRESSFQPEIKILKAASARAHVKCVYFYTCSCKYLAGLHDLLLLNASRFMQDGLVHIHVIGSGESEGLITQFKLLELSNVSVTYSDIDPGWTNRAAYYHAYRYLLLPILLELYRLPIMLLGSDTAFAQPAFNLVSDAPSSIALYFWNPRRRVPWKHIFADVVYFPYTQKGCMFAHAISNYLSRGDWDSGRLLYFDQVAVAFIYNYLRTKLGDLEVNDLLPRLKSGVCNTNGGGSLKEKLDNGLKWINSQLI